MRWAPLIVSVVACACGDHEPEIERRGDAVPDPGITPMPPACDEGAGGEGGVPAVAVRFCQAERVLRESCQRCHQRPPLNGAPFPLVTYEDTQATFDVGKARWQRMKEVVESNFMPLRLRLDPPVEPLTCEQKSTLLGWLEQCAQPEGGTACDDPNEVLTGCDERWRGE
jgi:hypothetical protein